MAASEPRFIPGDFIVFTFNNEREGMGTVTGAYQLDKTWHYYVTNPGNGQIPYVVNSNHIVSVYRNNTWEHVALEAQDSSDKK